MFFLSLLISLLCLDALLLILMILIQKGKGNMGLGSLGGGAQMLFGGSGGQDLFQKITWVLGSIFMVGSLILSILWSRSVSQSYQVNQQIPVQSQPFEQSIPQPTQEQGIPRQTDQPIQKQ
jgi:preprotein translocase subunit SecG